MSKESKQDDFTLHVMAKRPSAVILIFKSGYAPHEPTFLRPDQSAPSDNGDLVKSDGEVVGRYVSRS